ncbi:morphogenetic protein [Shewanella fodinae]|uniref:morphogenetic protein n=1 Tax=Shewanella fodinae TaxID=552357 RepID=UPI00167A29A9|nr:morphogenetic protein [Shewanella fodinae]MCL2905188.1 hypothetical protein [Shewanella fodinae]GGY87912.1 hypothetical protein GCM10007169_01360 [Shewanella fodinae]
MKERPIIFNGDMIRAILAGEKTQTRRPVNLPVIDKDWLIELAPCELAGEINNGDLTNSKYGIIGDHLWVRETFAIVPKTAYAHSDGVTQIKSPIDKDSASIYKADWCRSDGGIRWKPSIHMPRWACRIILEITNVRVERLQDIGEYDACAEGVGQEEHLDTPSELAAYSFHEGFRRLWKSLYGQDSWDANPWVWVIEFKVLTTNGVIPNEAAKCAEA